MTGVEIELCQRSFVELNRFRLKSLGSYSGTAL